MRGRALGLSVVLACLLGLGCGDGGESGGEGGSSGGGGTGGAGASGGEGGDGGTGLSGGTGGGTGGTGATGGSGGTAGTGGSDPSLGLPVRFGINGGHRNQAWGDATQAQLYVKGGCNSSRVSLPERHLDQWGYEIEVADMQAYASLGLANHVAFLTSPIRAHSTAPSSAADWELVHYKPANLYEPVTLPNGAINPDNYWGAYVHKTVATYKSWVKVWEIWNEPDWVDTWSYTQTWDTEPPTAEQLPRFRGSIYEYVRMLRVSREAALLADPEAKIATGGLGYDTFLAAILRYTDNPVDGSITAEYPETGGAYFDVVSFHHYPLYTPGNSEAAVEGYVSHYERMAGRLADAGVTGKTFVTTESGAPHVELPGTPSGEAYARNYLVKAMTLAHAVGVNGIDWYVLSDYAAPGSTDDAYGWMGLFEDIEQLGTPGEAVPTPTGIAYATLGKLLAGARHDPTATSALDLGGSVGGAAFRSPAAKGLYVLWAKATGTGEDASATYNLAASGPHRVHAWDHSATQASETLAPASGVITLSLSGSPVIVTEE